MKNKLLLSLFLVSSLFFYSKSALAFSAIPSTGTSTTVSDAVVFDGDCTGLCSLWIFSPDNSPYPSPVSPFNDGSYISDSFGVYSPTASGLLTQGTGVYKYILYNESVSPNVSTDVCYISYSSCIDGNTYLEADFTLTGSSTSTPPSPPPVAPPLVLNPLFQYLNASSTCTQTTPSTSPVTYFCTGTSTFPLYPGYGDWVLMESLILLCVAFIPVSTFYSMFTLKKKSKK